MANFKFMTLNTQSVNADLKKITLDRILKDHRPDVIGLTETWLKSNTQFTMNNYITTRCDRSTTGGGVAILVKHQIEHRKIDLPQLLTFEAVAVLLMHQDSSSSIFISIYMKPSAIFDGQELSMLIDVLPRSNNIIMCGDLNCKNTTCKCTSTDSNGTELFNWANSEDFVIGSSRFPSRGKEFIDVFLLRENIQLTKNHDELETLAFPSDHAIFVLRCVLSSKTLEAEKRFIFDWKSTNFEKFARGLDARTADVPIWEDRVMTTFEIENAIIHLSGNFNISMDLCVKQFTCKPKFEPNISTITMHFVNRLREERTSLARLKRSNSFGQNNAQIAAMTNSMKLLEKTVKERIKLDRQVAFKNRCQSIKPDPNLFKEIKKIAEYKKCVPVPNVVTINNCHVSDRSIHVEELDRRFEEIHVKARDAIDPNHRLRANFEMARLFNNYAPFMEFNQMQSAFIDKQ